MSKLFIIYIFLQCVSTFVWCDVTLEEQNTQNDLNPVNDQENNDETENREHDKRTIFNSELENYGWARHVGVHPSGFKYVLGIGPVDLKYVPVIKNPFKVPNLRQKWPSKIFKPFRPFKPIHTHAWKPRPVIVNPSLSVRPFIPVVRPVVPLVRPAVPFVKPAIFRPVPPPVSQWPNKSWHNDEWKKPSPVKPVIPLEPVNVVPVQPIVKPVPSPPQAVPVVPLQPVNPVVSIQQINPVPANPVLPVQSIHPGFQFQPAPQQILPVPTTISTDPWVPLVKPAYPLVPQQPLLEVTKPNLPVLPLGASFSSPVLQQVPAAPGIAVQKPQLIHQNPAPVVEFHGNHNHFVSPNGFINFPKLASIQPQYAPQFTQILQQTIPRQIYATGIQVQPNPTIPFDQGQPIPHFHQTVPQVTQVQQLPHPGQQFFPQVTQVQQLPQAEQQFNPQVQQLPQPEQHYLPQVSQFQQLSNQEQQINQIQQLSNQGQQVFDEQYLPSPAHGQLPLEGENSQQQIPQNPFVPQPNVLFQGQEHQFVSGNDIQQFQSTNSIQPGQTDVQTPLYLPPHHTYNPQVETFNNGFNQQFLSNQDNGQRPSNTLEPPYDNFGYTNRREDIVGDEVEDSTESI